MNNFRLRATQMYLQGMYFLDGTMSELRKLGILILVDFEPDIRRQFS